MRLLTCDEQDRVRNSEKKQGKPYQSPTREIQDSSRVIKKLDARMAGTGGSMSIIFLPGGAGSSSSLTIWGRCYGKSSEEMQPRSEWIRSEETIAGDRCSWRIKDT